MLLLLLLLLLTTARVFKNGHFLKAITPTTQSKTAIATPKPEWNLSLTRSHILNRLMSVCESVRMYEGITVLVYEVNDRLPIFIYFRRTRGQQINSILNEKKKHIHLFVCVQ